MTSTIRTALVVVLASAVGAAGMHALLTRRSLAPAQAAPAREECADCRKLRAIFERETTVAAPEARQALLFSNLQTLRSQIELYKVQHSDRTPADLGDFVTQLLTETDVDGKAGGEMGPYLLSMPANPFVDPAVAKKVQTGDENKHADPKDAGWFFNIRTGRLFATHDLRL